MRSHAVHQASVHPVDAFQVAADFLTLVKLILAVRIALAGRERLEFSAIPIRAGLRIQALDLLVAFQDLLGVEITSLTAWESWMFIWSKAFCMCSTCGER